MTTRLVLVLMLAATMSRAEPADRSAATQQPGAVAATSAQDQTGQPPGTIRGRILGSNGRPLRGARVEVVTAEEQRGRGLASTDVDGRYEIRGLGANSYLVSASKPGYVTLELGQRRAFEHGQPVTLRAGETLEKVDLTLPRAGAITGRLVDESGDPIEGASIQIMEIQFANGHRQLVQASGVRARMTNDLGRYRVWGLQPGQYVVTALVGSDVSGQSTAAKLPGYAPTYFPGTANASDAQLVTVGLAQEVSNADFALAPARTVRLAGTILDSSGQPSRANPILATSQRSGTVAALPVPGSVRPDGTFEIRNVPPGEYVLQALRPRPSGVAEAEFAMQYVTVSGSDITGIALRTSLASAVNGRVTVEGGGGLKPSDVHIMPAPVDFDLSPMIGFGFAGQVRDDWTFEMQGLSGPRLFRLGVPKGWALKAVRASDIDVTDTPMPLGTKDQSVNDLEIVVTNRVTDVTGSVTDARGQPVDDYTAIVFSVDAQRWHRFSRYIAFARAPQDGTFHVRGLAPGEYYVAAVDRMHGTEGLGEWQDPAFLKSIAPKGAKVTLSEGQTLSVGVKLIVR